MPNITYEPFKSTDCLLLIFESNCWFNNAVYICFGAFQDHFGHIWGQGQWPWKFHHWIRKDQIFKNGNLTIFVTLIVWVILRKTCKNSRPCPLWSFLGLIPHMCQSSLGTPCKKLNIATPLLQFLMEICNTL